MHSWILSYDFQLSDRPAEAPIIVSDMPQMAQFVYDFYNARVDDLMRQRGFIRVCMGLRLLLPWLSVKLTGLPIITNFLSFGAISPKICSPFFSRYCNNALSWIISSHLKHPKRKYNFTSQALIYEKSKLLTKIVEVSVFCGFFSGPSNKKLKEKNNNQSISLLVAVCSPFSHQVRPLNLIPHLELILCLYIYIYIYINVMRLNILLFSVIG